MRPLVLGTLTLALLAVAGCAAWRVDEARELARRSEPLQQTPAQPSLTMLVVGDSTAVGTGASAPQASLAGLIARDHPRLAVRNVARDGAKFADLPGQMAGVDARRYDVVLVQAGGNDVIRLTGEDALRRDVSQTLARARELGREVIVMPAGNVGNAPFFFAPVSWLMSQRARTLHRVVREAAAEQGAVYVNLYRDRQDDPFVQNPALNAADGLHPSDAGYRTWLTSLREQAALDTRLAAAR